MKGPPPYAIRRLVLAPLVVALAVGAIAALPLWIIAVAFASRFVPGRWRPLRVGWFLFLYIELEAITLLVLFAQWIASGFGYALRSDRFQHLTYRTAAWWLRRVMSSARRTFKVAMDVSWASAPPGGGMPDDRPALVMSRHAGPGDSFLLIDGILNGGGRNPRIVLKDLLRLDPCIDVALSRVPSRFVPSHGHAGDAAVTAIREMASTMGPRDAFVIFPEGGNYTVGRQGRAIAHLSEIGRADLAARARAMRHLLPPKPGGALTAIAAAPTADIVLIGHVGLERLSTIRDLWRGIPMDSDVTVRVWHIAAEDVPPPDEREAWLYDRWQEMDDWIDAQLAQATPTP